MLVERRKLIMFDFSGDRLENLSAAYTCWIIHQMFIFIFLLRDVGWILLA